MPSPLYFTLAAGVILSFAGANANAVQPASYSANVTYYVNDTPVANQATGVLAVSGSFATISACVVSTATRTACASAYAAAGRLGSQSSMVDVSPDTIPGGAESSNGNAVFTDVLIVGGSSLSGSYTLIPTITISGTGSWNNVALPQTIGLGIAEYGPDGTTFIDQLFPDATPNASSYSNSFQLNGIPFQPGVPFNLALDFGEAARIYNGPPSSENTQVNANFLSTMLLTGLAVLDSNGNPVADFSIHSASGALYGPNGVVVTLNSTLADIANSLQLGLIDNRGIANSLSQKIQNVQKASGPARANILNAFENEVNDQAGKHITGVAVQVLLQDVGSLIGQNQ